MPIAGLKQRTEIGRIKIKVYKGDPKKNGTTFGPDLNEKLRITTGDMACMHVLKKYYGDVKYDQVNKLWHFHTESINIYLPYDQVTKVFVTAMERWDASTLKLRCDRNTITHEMVQTKDAKGNVCNNLLEVNKECPVAGEHLGYECPNGCDAIGVLYFYIREIMDEGYPLIPCQLTTHSYEDLVYFGDEEEGQLARIKEWLGGLSQSPFPCQAFSHYIPYTLGRTKVDIKRPVLDNKVRTGKKAAGVTFALSLEVLPVYVQLFQVWQHIQSQKQYQLPVSDKMVAGLLKGDIIDVDATPVQERQLPPAATSQQLPPAASSTTEVWRSWRNEEDAIAWAMAELPNFPREELVEVLAQVLPDQSGKKAPAFMAQILRFQQQIEDQEYDEKEW